VNVIKIPTVMTITMKERLRKTIMNPPISFLFVYQNGATCKTFSLNLINLNITNVNIGNSKTIHGLSSRVIQRVS